MRRIFRRLGQSFYCNTSSSTTFSLATSLQCHSRRNRKHARRKNHKRSETTLVSTLSTLLALCCSGSVLPRTTDKPGAVMNDSDQKIYDDACALGWPRKYISIEEAYKTWPRPVLKPQRRCEETGAYFMQEMTQEEFEVLAWDPHDR